MKQRQENECGIDRVRLDCASSGAEGRLSRSHKGMALLAEQRRIVRLLAAGIPPTDALASGEKNGPGEDHKGIDKAIQSSDLKCATEASEREAFRLVRRELRALGLRPRYMGDGTYRVTTDSSSYVLSDPVAGAQLVLTLAGMKRERAKVEA